MLSTTESSKTLELDDYLVVTPEININRNYNEKYGNKYRVGDSEYSSGDNVLISDESLLKMIDM